MSIQEQMKIARAKFRQPVELAAKRIFTTPDGRVVLDALNKVFGDAQPAYDREGRVDPNGTLINIGAANVVSYLRTLAELKEGTGE